MTAPLSPKTQQQRAHWDGVLDAGNLGGEAADLHALERAVGFTRGDPGFGILIDWVGTEQIGTVVDLGGGLGPHAVALARAGAQRVVVADISAQRLRRLAGLLDALGLRDRVALVQCAAEALPIRSGSVEGLWTHSVLIHTDLECAAAEIARALGPKGDAVLSEPMDRNPLVNLYRRTLAPKEWEGITDYFTPERERVVLDALAQGRAHRRVLLGFSAFVWQFALPVRPLFLLARGLFHVIDSVLFLIPGAKRLAWFTVMTGRGR